MKKPLIAGNWKMFLDRKTGKALAEELVKGTKNTDDRDILICPAFPLLSDIARVLAGSSIFLGAQNMYFEQEGAFTGEVSADMLLSVGCTHVILGHSERRHVFHEGNEYINKKVRKALREKLIPILCVGELLDERETGKTEKVVKEQIAKGLGGIDKKDMGDVIVAYEPVWAIGTGKTATPEDADQVHDFIRKTVSELYNEAYARDLRVLYGGSVKPENINGLMKKENIDGALVGGASLRADSFLKIINSW